MPTLLRRSLPLVVIAIFASLFNPAAPAEEMIFPGQEWIEATPEFEHLDAAQLAAAADYLKQRAGQDGVRELVIARRGRLVWKGNNIDHRHGVWSCTKSFTSTVLGLLIDDGKCTLDTLAKEYVPELADKFSGITLRHLATMTSGYRAAGDEPRGTYKHGPSTTPFVPGPEPLFAPGTKYAYWDSAMNLFGLVLTRIAGEPLEVYFKRRIADPIGMNAAAWDWGDHSTDRGVVVNGGSGNGNKHVLITAREMARFGLLFLNGGNWNGKQLISRTWVDQATAVQVPALLSWGHSASEIDGRGVYGFNWWRNGTRADGRSLWPGAPPATYAACGHNNNRLFVIPDWQMVVVRLGLDQGDRKIRDEEWGEFLRQIGTARTEDIQKQPTTGR